MDVRYRGAFAEAYVQSLALGAGLNVHRSFIDDDGVDLMVRYSGDVGTVASPGVDLQVKSWSRPVGADDYWHFDGLNERQYNKLAGNNYQMPRFLVLILVPDDMNRLVELLDDGLILRHRAYYASFASQARVDQPDTRRRHRVLVPKANLLTVPALRGLLHSDLACTEASL